MALFDDDDRGGAPNAAGNRPEYTVSELSGAVKRVIEGEFGLVRVRGEIGRISRPASGHLYFDLKDERSVMAAISWKGQAARLATRPEEGMEVIATGRMTTFPGQSKYQLIVEDISPAGAGALMLMLEKRRVALAGEGLFDAARKKPIPYLPEVIGVITSPSGAVIRDILHRLRDRFARHVLVWPVAVQGQDCPAQVAAALRGFNAVAAGGAVPRPDVLIVARGGGSIEDLWGFNDEAVVRAVAQSDIPVISAVGHETDTTLIDHAADRRAPTPSAAAEMAVPVRLDLVAHLGNVTARLARAIAQTQTMRAQRLHDVARALPRLDALLLGPAQRIDAAGGRLSGALVVAASLKRNEYERRAARLTPQTLLSLTARRGEALARQGDALRNRVIQRTERAAAHFDKWAPRLAPALARLSVDAARQNTRGRTALGGLSARLGNASAQRFELFSKRLDALDRIRQNMGYTETLRRGYAVVRAQQGGAVLTTRSAAQTAGPLEIEFSDGRFALGDGGRSAGFDGGFGGASQGGGSQGSPSQGSASQGGGVLRGAALEGGESAPPSSARQTAPQRPQDSAPETSSTNPPATFPAPAPPAPPRSLAGSLSETAPHTPPETLPETSAKTRNRTQGKTQGKTSSKTSPKATPKSPPEQGSLF